MARQSDAEKNNSTQMNATAAEAAVKEDGGVRIVFIATPSRFMARRRTSAGTMCGAWPPARWKRTMSIS